MFSEDLSQAVVTMEPRADSIRAVCEMLLAALAEPGAASDERLDEQAAYFVEETYRTVLNWMASGKEEEVRALLTQWLAVFERRLGGDVLADLSPDDRLAARLAVLTEVGAVFLRTDNLLSPSDAGALAADASSLTPPLESRRMSARPGSLEGESG